MAKKTKSMAATLKEGRAIRNKNKKPRSSTIDQTIATSSDGFKQKKKLTKTRTMVETLKQAVPKTKKVSKKHKTVRKTKPAKKSKPAKKIIKSSRTARK